MRRDDSTSERVNQLLGRSSARTPEIEDDDAWPPGWPADPDGEPPEPAPGGLARLMAGADRFGTAGAGAVRWQVPGRAAAAVGVLALLIVAVVGTLLLRGSTSGTPVPTRDPVPFATTSSGLLGAATSTPTAGSTGTAADPVVGAAGTAGPSPGLYRVYVVGQVRQPGVVSLAPDARVEDAIKAAGGATEKADLAVMNLARKIVDGERIVVPRPGEKLPTEDPVPAPAGGTTGGDGGGSAGAPGAPLDLNTATVAQFDALPGVGPVIAARIVAWREQNGRFNRVDDLGEVQGIGDATLEKLRPLVRV